MCRTCGNVNTRIIAPICLRRLALHSFLITGVCESCKDTVVKFLNGAQVHKLPKVILDIPIRDSVIGYVRNEENEAIELFPLLDNAINC